jgi:hypothetical protein
VKASRRALPLLALPILTSLAQAAAPVLVQRITLPVE